MAWIKLYPYLSRFLPDLDETGLQTSACNAVTHFELREETGSVKGVFMFFFFLMESLYAVVLKSYETFKIKNSYKNSVFYVTTQGRCLENGIIM